MSLYRLKGASNHYSQQPIKSELYGHFIHEYEHVTAIETLKLWEVTSGVVAAAGFDGLEA